MRTFYLTYIFLILVQCNTQSVEDLKNESPVMWAVIPNGSNTSGIQLYLLDEHNSIGKAITDATISIMHYASTNSVNLNYINGKYEGSLEIETNETYVMRGKVLDHDFTAEIKIPPAIDFTSPINDTLIVDSTSNGTTLLIATWNELDQEKYSYVVRLDCLEDSPIEIPFPVTSGNFASNFSGPQVAAGIIVADNDFKFYGRHKLSIFAIPKSLEKVYFYNASDIRGLLTNGPDNILGIKGFVTGVSVLEDEIYIKPL